MPVERLSRSLGPLPAAMEWSDHIMHNSGISDQSYQVGIYAALRSFIGMGKRLTAAFASGGGLGGCFGAK